MNIRLENIVKRFGPQTVINQINLEIRGGELFLLLGPSGCGKTTLLRMLAGFCHPDSGQLFFGEKSMADVPPNKRQTAMVFQNYALWPHLTVFENVAYGLKVRKIPKGEIVRRVEEALEQIRMSRFQGQKPTQLSGGQQQRVALARAFVVRPDVLLFDEPLCNLDEQLRLEMRAEIKRLHAATGITSLYVTHDQEEALSLATRIGVMHQGVIQQLGTPIEIYNHPINPFVAQFIGEMNILPYHSPFAVRLRTLSEHQTLGFRPENVLVNRDGNGFLAQVVRSTYLGSKNELILKTESGEEIKAWTSDYFAEGTRVYFGVPDSKLMIW